MGTIPTGQVPNQSDWFQGSSSVRFTAPITPRVMAWWRKSFIRPFDLTPHELAEIVSWRLPDFDHVEFYRIDPKAKIVSFAIGSDPNQVPLAWLAGQSLHLDDQLPHIDNDATFLHETRQRRGIGTQLIANLVVLAERIQIGTLALDAVESGPYVWGTFGFAPVPGDWAAIKPAIVDRLDHFRSVVGERVYREVRSDLASPNPQRIWGIADRTEMVWSAPTDGSKPPARVRLGEALLAHSGIRWYGTLELDDPVASLRLQQKIQGYLP